MNKRILILNRRYSPGEAWTNRILAYAKGFAKSGMEVRMYFLIGDHQHIKTNIHIPGVTIVNIWENDGWLGKHSKVISFIINLFRFIKEVDIGDIVFQYGIMDYQLLLANKLKSRAKVFCEVTEHPQYNNGNFLLSKKRRKNILCSLDGLFVISHQLRSLYINIGLDESKVHVVNMFVDTTRFDGLRKTTKEKYIAYCGAVSYDKDGVNILIEAFAKFHIKHPEYKLYIFGKGTGPNILKNLKVLSKKYGIQDSIHFTGPISPSEMPQKLHNAHILALARPDNLQAQNGFPTKLGEYLATGNPVVVTNVGEIPLFIKDGVNGYLTSPNASSFAEKLDYIANHYEEAATVGVEGKELANDAFNYLTQSNIACNIMKNYYKDYNFGIQGYRGNLKGLVFIICYRIAHYFTRTRFLYFLGFPIWILYRFIFRWILGIDIPERVKIGSNCKICHGIGIVIHPDVIIGDNVKLHQNTTIGKGNDNKPPIIGNNVVVGANCVIIGNIRIGDGAIIGAGAVVTKDIPQNAIVVGNPARIIKYRNQC